MPNIRQPMQSGFGFGPPGRTGPVTKTLVGALVAVSLVGAVTQRRFGAGVQNLDFRIDAVLAGEFWRLFTYPFVETTPFGLLIGAVVLWLFGRWFESTWGRRDFVRFFALTSLGAALLAMPLSYLVNHIMPFYDVGRAEGPDPAINAMLVALAVEAPSSNILFGFVLPMRARTVVLVILGFQLVVGIQTGAAAVSTTLGGMLMGYLLATGNWRPRRLWNYVTLWRLRRKRRGFRVVPPRERTLH